MTALLWDEVGDRRYETGVDRGILFLSDGSAVPWNGLTSVEEQVSQSRESFYLDGVKYLDRVLPGESAAILKAYTYPDEFEEILGVVDVLPGMAYYNQPNKMFNLVYRNIIGNDVDGTAHGYKIHVWYNLTAVPDAETFQTLGDVVSPTEFSWNLTGTPKIIGGHRPTIHVSFDSRTDPDRFAAVERLLYGTATSDPLLPAIDTLTALYNTYNDLIVTDNGDGTWTAVDVGDHYFVVAPDGSFTFDDATIIDADTYTLSTDTPP